MSSSVNSSLIYTPSPESLNTDSSYYAPIKANNGSTFGPGSSIYIDIAAQRNTFLDVSNSWLEFELEFSGTMTPTTIPAGTVADLANFNLTSAGANGLIQSVYTWGNGGSTNLETLTNYPTLTRMLNVLTVGQDTNNSIRTICGGIQEATTLNNNLLGEAIGEGTTVGGVTTYSYKKMKFAIPLCSSVLGTMSNGRYLPLHFLNSSVRLQLDTVTQAIDACVNNTSTIASIGTDFTYKMTNVQYMGKYVRVTDASVQEITRYARQDPSGIISWNSTGFRSYRNACDTTGINKTTQTFLVPARFRSLNNLICAVTHSRAQANDLLDPQSTTVPWTEWYSRIGGTQYPPVAIQSVPSMAQFLMSCFHSVSNTLAETVLSEQAWPLSTKHVTSSTLPLTDSTKAYTGISFESFNDSAGTVNGLDSSTDIIEVVVAMDGNVFNSGGQITFCVNYDCLYSIDNEGNLSVSY